MSVSSDFLSGIYAALPGDLDARLTLWDRQTRRSYHLDPLDLVAAGDFAAELDRKGLDAYFGVGLRTPGMASGARGRRVDVVALPGFFLDVDTTSAAHTATNLPADLGDALALLEVVPFAPTSLVDSGHGLHAYWLFTEIQRVTPEGWRQLDLLAQAFQDPIIAAAAARGWHLDKTGNIDRVLRVPGTWNRKAPTAPVPVLHLLGDGPRHRFEDLAAWVQGQIRTQVQAAAPAPAAPPPPPAAGAPQGTLAEVRQSLTRLKNPATRALLAKVLAGESFAAPGERDATLQKVASVIGYVAPDTDPAELAREILGPSLAHWDDVDAAGGQYTQATRLEWAAEKIARAQASKREERAELEAQAQAIVAAIPDRVMGAGPDGRYTDDQIETFARQQGTNPAGFRKRWIIQREDAYYVYVDGAYKSPITSKSLETSLLRDLAPCEGVNGFTFTTYTAKGDPRAKTLKEIMRDYGTVARNLIADLALQVSAYDPDSETFLEAAAPVRRLTPQYDQDVDTWLRTMGGPLADKLLDWIATVTNLAHQTCALYLEGPPGTGKTVLSKGLARLWTMGSPTEIGRILDAWTADLARCPLVVADEQIPKSFRGQRASAELRSLIGSSSRTLTRKHLPNADLRGAVRLILAANNSELLVFDESLSTSDLEAVAGRFLHIVVPEAAKTFVESVDTSEWVEGDKIARHALWLRDHRAVAPGKRFLVEGRAEAMIKLLAVQGEVPSRVVEWLAKYLADMTPKAGPTQRNLVHVGGGKYLVNVNALVDFWDLYVRGSKGTPAHNLIGSALRNLACGPQTRVKNVRYWPIDPEVVLAWAERHQVGDPDFMRARLAAGVAADAVVELDA